VLASGFFSGSETALNSCNQFKFRVRANDDSFLAKNVCIILDKFNKLQISIVVENNIVNTLISTLAAILFFEYYFKGVAADEGFANLVSTIVITVIIYIFGETLPKILARSVPDGFISIAAFVLIPLYYILWPINILFYLTSNLMKKIFKVKEDITMTEEDFSNFVDESEELGKLDEDESDIIQNALDFVDTSIKEVYTPLNKIYAIDIEGMNNEKLNKILINSNYSRIPVFKGKKENIVGILNVKQYFNAYLKNSKFDFRTVLTKPYFVSPNMKLDDIFNVFRNNHTHIALIQTNNKIVGMITMEDVLEELVGEIAESSTKSEEK
jgi:putative hemolysin